MNQAEMIQALLAGGGLGPMPGTMPYAPVGGNRSQQIRAMQRSGMLAPHQRDWDQWAKGGMPAAAAPAATPPAAGPPPQLQALIGQMLQGAGGGVAQGAGMMGQGANQLGAMAGGMFGGMFGGGRGVGQPIPQAPASQPPPMVSPNPQSPMMMPPRHQPPDLPIPQAPGTANMGSQQIQGSGQTQQGYPSLSPQQMQEAMRQEEAMRQQEMLRQAQQFIATKMREREFQDQQ